MGAHICVATIGNLAFLVFAAMAPTDVFFERHMALGFCLTSCFASVAVVRAYLRTNGPHRSAWPAILLNGGTTVCIFALIYQTFGVLGGHDPAGAPRDFSTMLYFSIVTFTTLGYGEFHPTSATRMFAATQAAFGYIYLGLIVGAAIHWEATRRR